MVDFQHNACYTASQKISGKKGIAVKLGNKLDRLQEMMKECGGDPRMAYMIGLLAEHAEEDEMTAEFLEWVVELLK